MKELEIQRKLFILLDDEDFEDVSKYPWHVMGKRIARTYWQEGKTHTMFLDYFLKPYDKKAFTVRHRNNIQMDYRKVNLQIVPLGTSRGTRKISKANKSGFLGVYWDKQSYLWRAGITINHKWQNLGRFQRIEDAALAYNKAALDLYGDHAELNDVDSFEAHLLIDSRTVKQPRIVGKQPQDKHGKQLKEFVRQIMK